jgi:hypothetical protein
MLHRLARKPEILNTVAVLPARGADLGRQTAKYIASNRIYDDKRFASNPMQSRETPLTYSRFLRNLGSESEFGDGDGRKINGLVAGQSGNVSWSQESPFYVDPYARVD